VPAFDAEELSLRSAALFSRRFAAAFDSRLMKSSPFSSVVFGVVLFGISSDLWRLNQWLAANL